MKRQLVLIMLVVMVLGLYGEWKVDEGFETGEIPSDWTIIDGEDGSTWMAYENNGVSHGGDWVAFSESYSGGQDNWLILPQTLIEAGDEVSMYIRSWYSTEDFEILVSVDDNEPNDFDDELISVEGQENEYTEYSFDLSEYAGQEIYVGIHWICDTYALLVDDVKLGQSGGTNTAPEMNLPAEISFDENSSLTVDFSQYISDIDGDELTLSVSDNNEVTVEIVGLDVSFSAEIDWFGEDIMLFYVSDGEYTVSDFLTVVVLEANENTAPEIDLPSEIIFDENSSITVDFGQYVFDAEDDELTLSVSDNNEVIVDIEGLDVTFSAEADWYGDDVMIFYVSDGEFTDSDFLTVVVNEVAGNTAPEINLPGEFSFIENGSLTVDFEEYVYDEEGDELTLAVSDNNEVIVEIDGLEVTFSTELGWFGEDVMMFHVSDGEFTDSDFLTVIVMEAPEPGWSVDEGFEDGEIPADWTIIDGDEGSTWIAYENAGYAHEGSWMALSESYNGGQDNWLILPQVLINAGDEFSFFARSWYSTEDFEVLVSVEDNEVNDFDDELEVVEGQEDDYTNYLYDLSEYAGQEIYVGIHWICDTYALLIDDVKLGQEPGGNTAPEINLPESISFEEDTIYEMDFSEYVSDAEGDELTLSVSGNQDIIVDIAGLIVTFSAAADWFGEELMDFTVSDGEYETTDEMTVIITDVADHIYGDVDDNGLIESYDASLILQYVVGFDPAPAAPLPWEDWRLEMADVDNSGEIGAYDAALILQYVVGIIDEFPVVNELVRTGNCDIKALVEGNEIILSVKGEVYSLYIELPAGGVFDNTTGDMVIYNRENGRLAAASAVTFSGKELRVSYSKELDIADITGKSVEINGRMMELRIGETEDEENVQASSLYGNYPNPFNPRTLISFEIADNEQGELNIYNLRGELLEHKIFISGKHKYEWQADEYGSGIYLYRLKTGSEEFTGKMTLIK